MLHVSPGCVLKVNPCESIKFIKRLCSKHHGYLVHVMVIVRDKNICYQTS